MNAAVHTAADVVAAARSLMGRPWAHQGRTLAGMDCLGMLALVGDQVGLHVDEVPAYGRVPDGRQLQAGLRRHLMPEPARTPPMPGHMVLLRVGLNPHHVGVIAGYRHGGLSLIHSNAKAGGVTEHRLTPAWAAAIVELYRVPGVIYP
jgi:cell wall-associated NlpC family hydrolase